MRWLRVAAPALVLAAWCAGSAAQQPVAPPAGTPPTSTPPARPPPASTPQSGAQPPATPPAQQKEGEKPQAASDQAEDEFIPTEELQPDAAVTFPVDI
jgi:hypothetical protein